MILYSKQLSCEILWRVCVCLCVGLYGERLPFESTKRIDELQYFLQVEL